MKIFLVAVAAAVLAGCGWGDSAHRDEHRTTPGEAAGKATYYLQKDAKKAAKELGHDLKTFGHDAHEGFQDAKQKDVEKKKAKEQP